MRNIMNYANICAAEGVVYASWCDMSTALVNNLAYLNRRDSAQSFVCACGSKTVPCTENVRGIFYSKLEVL